MNLKKLFLSVSLLVMSASVYANGDNGQYESSEAAQVSEVVTTEVAGSNADSGAEATTDTFKADE